MMSDLEKRNAKAVMQALRDQDDKIRGIQDEIAALARQLSMLNDGLNELRKQNMEDLVAKFGSGPTS